MTDIMAVFVVVERGKADYVEETRLQGHCHDCLWGTGEKEFKKFFNLNVESSKEIILILTSQEQKDGLVAALVKAGNLKDPGTGILFTVPVGELVGLDHRKGILTD